MESQMNAKAKLIGASLVLILAGGVEAQDSKTKLPSVAVEPNARADQLRRDAMNHYDKVLTLGLTAAQKSDLVEYLKSL